MRVSLSWLNDYVDISGVDPAELAEALTNAGLEVEGVETSGVVFSGVVVGKILAIEPHPNADKLRLATVTVGHKEHKVVCGAANLELGQYIAYAQLGAKVISGKSGELFELTPVSIRGVESAGMICSLSELGLLEQYPNDEPEGKGIWVLNAYVDDSHLGQPLCTALNLTTDTVLDAAPTANRGDHMAMVGVARDVAAILDRPVTLPESPTFDATPSVNGYTVQLDNPNVCCYYGGVLLKNLTVGSSPVWVQQRLEAAGVRAISNVVDVTNYVMLELGQPLHAFDADKLGPGTIGVRHAKSSETLKTLDGSQLTLTEQSVVIVKDNHPVALAGVMGGESTEMDDTSKTLFIEAASFPPASNRRNAKSVGLRTESSARFERGVDLGTTRKALFRAVQLLKDWANAEVIGFIESPAPVIPEVLVDLRLARLNQLLGVAVEKNTVIAILEKLCFGVSPKSDDVLSVSVPSYRQHDVYREVDLIEEVIRIHGLNHIPYTLPQKTKSTGLTFRQQVLAAIRQTMTGAGLFEATTNSLIGEALLTKTGFELDRSKLVQVTNSHSQDHILMRQSVLPTLIDIAKFNQAQGNQSVQLFELGRTYWQLGKPSEKHSGVVEKLSLCGIMTGAVQQGQWHVDNTRNTVDFYTVKGIVEQLLQIIGVSDTAYQASDTISYLHPGQTAEVGVLKKGKFTSSFGTLGQLHPRLQEKMKFRSPVFVFELDVEALIKLLKQQPSSKSFFKVSPYPAVERDLAFVVSNDVSHQAITNVIQGLDHPLLKSIDLFDEYRGERLGPDQRSLAYRLTLQSETDTLTDTVIDDAINQVRQALIAKLAVTFR